MEAATLLVAVLGVVLGTASLVWQVAEHMLTGRRVRVGLLVGAMRPGGGLSAWHKPEDLKTGWDRRLAEQGFTRPVVAVRVTNVGRMPATVERWGFRAPQGTELTPIADSIGPGMPHRLDHGESETWAIDIGAVIAFSETTRSVLGDSRGGGAADSVIGTIVQAYRRWRAGPPGTVGFVDLGDGRRKRSRAVLPF